MISQSTSIGRDTLTITDAPNRLTRTISLEGRKRIDRRRAPKQCGVETLVSVRVP
jgi:hypothetical protein